ncbi:MAG: metallophosphoesterase [Candidatus Hadarchaeales archaeon]
MIKLIPGEPALMVRAGGQKILVVADLHLGVEGELAESGISLPSQTPKVKKRLLSLVERFKPDRIILLGDVKHGIPVASWQEWRELPALLEELMKYANVEIVPGNHDGDIEGMVPRGVVLHDVRGIKLGNSVGLLHGHAWPSPDVMGCKVLVMGHTHPAVEIRDKYGGRIVEPVWLKVELERSKLPKELRVGKKCPKLIVMPAFGEMVGGAPVNRKMSEEFIGPMFKSGAANVLEAEVYLLDGTLLGRVRNLEKIAEGCETS